MMPEHTTVDLVDSEPTTSKRGYSIWSLLVIMTLLAVWLAVPRTVSKAQWSESVLVFFIVGHQVTLWALVGSVIWLVTGRRRIVIYMLAAILAIVWGPLVLVAVERGLFNSEYVAFWLVRSRIADVLDPLYRTIAEAFDYEPR